MRFKITESDLYVVLDNMNDLMKTVNGDKFGLEKLVGSGWKLHRQIQSPMGFTELVSPNYYITKSMMYSYITTLTVGMRMYANQIEKQTKVTV